MIDETMVRLVADAAFGLQAHLLEKCGGVDKQIHGYTFEEGKIKGVADLDFKGDFVADGPKLVQAMLEKFPVVTAIAEVWTSGNGGVAPSMSRDREEQVMIRIHTKEAVWVMLCPIRRGPDRLERGELVMPQMLTGRGIVGSAAPGSEESLSTAIDQILRSKSSLWKSELAIALGGMFDDLHTVQPATNVVYKHDVPAEKLTFAHAALELMCTSNVKRLDDPYTVDQAFLIGWSVRMLRPRDGGWPEWRALSAALRRVFERVAGDGQDWRLVAPHGVLCTMMPMVRLELAQNIFQLGVMSDSAPGSADLKEQVNRLAADACDRFMSRTADDPIAPNPVLTIPLVARLRLPADEHTSIMDPCRTPAALARLMEEKAVALKGEVEKALAGQCESLGVSRYYDALREQHMLWLKERITGLLKMAMAAALRKGSRAHAIDPKEMTFVLGTAVYKEPTAYDAVLATVWNTEGFLLPLVMPRLPFWNLDDYAVVVGNVARELGVGHVRFAPVEASEGATKIDKRGAYMYPDVDGKWFSPMELVLGTGELPKAVGAKKLH